MCGICGSVRFTGPADAPEVLAGMVRAISHRGPDHQGVYRDAHAALGHARLSIIDLSSAGCQPMTSHDGTIVMVFNGEVYNFASIRQELEDLGARFRGHSDSEVILEAYAHWGINALPRFNGMFAVAFWHVAARRLVLARDRFGIKPLFARVEHDGISFGSEIKAVLATGRGERAMDSQGLAEFLWFGNPLGATSMFRGIQRVLPGHVLEISAAGTALSPFVRFEDLVEKSVSVATAITSVRERLRGAVESHLVSDVPVGVFLSGGIDSSAITAFASKSYGRTLATYSVGFDFDRGINELPKARRVAETFGTDHHELSVTAGDLPDVLTRLVDAHDEPFGDAANIPLFLLCRALDSSVKVILQGDGGDEIFAGYRRYDVLTRTALWGRLARVGAPLVNLLPASPRQMRVSRFLTAVGEREPAMRMAMLLTQESQRHSPMFALHPDMRREVERQDPFLRYREQNARFAKLDPVQRMLYTDCALLLPNTFLEKVDRATMAHAIEIRVPFLDVPLTEYAMALPSSMKVRRGEKKWILRRALRGIVPDDILDGPKIGFGVPYEFWLRKPLAGLMRETLLSAESAQWGLLDQRVVARLIEEHVSGAREHGYLLWKLLQLTLWYGRYVGAH